jgi:hypothetical protein
MQHVLHEFTNNLHHSLIIDSRVVSLTPLTLIHLLK